MEISAIEINLLSEKISEAISSYFLSGVYSMEDGALFRFNHATKPEKLVAVSSFAPWITTKNLSMPQASRFVSRLRDQVERYEIVAAKQVGNERITKFSFVGRKGEKRDIYAEFFSRGNLILTDPTDNEVILDLANPQSFRHRTLASGEKYVLPPSRGVALQEIDEERLLSIFEQSKQNAEDQKLSGVKWFGRKIGTSRKFVEEIFKRANVNLEIALIFIDKQNLADLVSAVEELLKELKQSKSGHILIPAEESELDIDVCPIIPHSWKVFAEKGLARIQSYPSLSDALDEVQIQALVLDRRRKASLEVRSKAAELASAITKQTLQIEKNRTTAERLRTIASGLMRETDSTIKPEIIRDLQSYELLETTEETGNRLRFVTEPRAFLHSFNTTSLASRLFDEAKRLEESNRKVKEVMLALEAQKSTLVEQTKSQEEKAGRKIVTERRERQWFERYRWFATSDGKLAIGGRDSTSNSIMINKYTNRNDVIFHADIHGSPFFVLRNSEERKAPEDDIALELAQATVSFSRAWKDELGSADAYWVFGDQVKKSAPSGEYLPRGSFFIEGKKNFIRHVKVELSVGVASIESLPRDQAEDEIESKVSEQERATDQVAVVCGPDKSLAKYCLARVRISPGKEKASDFARRIKRQLVGRLKDEKGRESSKKLSIDEIILVLPSGGYKLVSEK